ncbi:hypothetical protein IE81DRAFT_323878 [Ceraceosorus guamensis]|uniref:Uncharacterized protein n=1 Tax=Ceraceosorus guamensis TaxID=1522189 RepID=A0A316W317_9BASI|nr:hypothetical protein IE81DRAFT_323878 [Ceraceosorus guamensis]PWN42055.1 hypothetical protein IE81DRAFT_323878 [Ceraceosorus guamensis]
MYHSSPHHRSVSHRSETRLADGEHHPPPSRDHSDSSLEQLRRSSVLSIYSTLLSHHHDPTFDRDSGPS